ncbi:hypothetical protein NQ315_013442 [Exocentrus adspersus]|uniref:Coenzyme Q-binding protein COQ10 START domain-containing protein n=1 Tax=Exocentrus adspersus TaxID=1586481 RepID=A0AAV8VHK6_9CUCU|nr:hypothetical protein NQ315_013442 [Exocentrus adspersus]
MQTAKVFLRYFHRFKKSERKKEYIARKLVGYKQFLPFCTKSVILVEQPKQLQAILEIGFPPVTENYTSTVTLDRPNFVRAVCRDGRIFNYLETLWIFSPGLRSNPKSCIIDFSIKFEFKAVLYSRLANMFFDKLVQQMENAFIEEAKKRYGQESLPSHELSPEKC